MLNTVYNIQIRNRINLTYFHTFLFRRAQFTGTGAAATSHGSTADNRHIHIPGISYAIMREIIEYAYRRKCSINADNVHEILVCADYVGIVGLVRLCKQYLAQMLTPENCVSIMGFSR